jgi:alpha-amylase/alpha-mannosidase (GH57 family)
MQPVSLALLWHQHQPYYADDVSGETLMPWVRLHGTKDYYGMALHLKEVPEFRCTINLVPSLLLQLLKYTEGGGSDRHLDVSRLPADGLSEADVCYLLDHFFMANLDNMIRPYPRYHELYLKRGFGVDRVERAVPRFSERDLRDLQVWNNLTWMHPLAFELDAELRDFLSKGRNWSEKDKEWLLDKQLDILRQVIPLHRQLAESGQVELTTSPFYHPILPLLWDKRSARQAMPGCNLPKALDSYKEDVSVHLTRAVEFHRNLFGAPPAGLWPSEGSVAQQIVAAIAEAGIEWIATDEEILAESTNGWVSRDGHGHMRHPEMLFRPWRVEDGDRRLQIVFRDHALSDLIGFHYQRSDPTHAAGDLLGRIEGIARAVEPHNSGRPALVPIILDGENCWEYYPDGGVQFLRTLYRNCVAHRSIRPVRMRDYLREHPATDKIGQLFAGSWISHNFAIWIGHAEDVAAWDLLHQTREFLKQAESTAEAGAKARPALFEKAWEEIYIAEGSDWFWWFGDDHSSELDHVFDQLFRKHLQNVYTLLGVPYPSILNQPISRGERRPIHTQPTGFLPVKIDGRRTYFEWISAGHYSAGNERGTMTMTSEGLLREVYFGFDRERLLLRIDTAGRAADDLRSVDELHVRFLEPAETDIRITGWRQAALAAKLYRNDKPVPAAVVEVAADRIVELAVKFADMNLKPDDPIRLFLEAVSGNRSIDRAPHEGAVEFRAPSPHFELLMWQA